MKLTSLAVENFRSIGLARLDLRNLRAVIHGPNGAGKSSLVYALAWAVWGELPTSDAGGCVRIGADLCRAVVEWEHAGTSWRVERSRRSGARCRG